MNSPMKILLFTFLIFVLTQNVIWKKFPQRTSCELEMVIETTVLSPNECVPLPGSRKSEWVTGRCERQRTEIKKCLDSSCTRNCTTENFINDRCHDENDRNLKQQFSCGNFAQIRPQDFTFQYFMKEDCSGKSSFNIIRGNCIPISGGLSWRNYCDKKQGIIKSEYFRNGDCSGQPEEDSDRPVNVCQPSWMGSYHVIFRNCTKN